MVAEEFYGDAELDWVVLMTAVSLMLEMNGHYQTTDYISMSNTNMVFWK